MSETNLDPNDGTQSEGGHQETNQSEERFFVFRPVAFLEYAAKQAEKYNHEYGQNGRLSHPFRAFYYRAVGSRAFRWAALGAIVVAFVAYLCWLRFLDAAQTQAFFAGVITFATFLTWWAMYAQNEIMLKQIRQTDEIVGSMRMEQRAWLTIINASIGRELTVGKQIAYTIKVRNSGNTPGRITAGTIACYIRESPFPSQALIEEFEQKGFLQNGEFIIPPRKSVKIIITDLPALDATMIDSLRLGSHVLHVLSRFRYIDVMDETHEIKAFHTLDLKSKGLYLRNNYGSMD